METIRLTMAQALVRYLIAQRTMLPGQAADAPLFPGVYAIFGHGNVTSLGHALQEAGEALPTWRGQNEQGMALAAVGFGIDRHRSIAPPGRKNHHRNTRGCQLFAPYGGPARRRTH